MEYAIGTVAALGAICWAMLAFLVADLRRDLQSLRSIFLDEQESLVARVTRIETGRVVHASLPLNALLDFAPVEAMTDEALDGALEFNVAARK